MNRKKILVIFTGGTIGSVRKSGYVSTESSAKYLLLSEYKKIRGENEEFSVLAPYEILSENLSAEKLNLLIKTVRDNLNKGFDGIIVTHGTDTLQYSAAALTFALGEISVPVALVSANYPLEDERSNGLDNFIAAVEFIKSNISGGVFVCYRNGDKPASVFKGDALFTHGEMTDELRCIGEEPYAVYDGAIKKNHKYRSLTVSGSETKCILCDSPGIILLTAAPGDAYLYDLTSASAVIIKPYHSGTLNTDNPHFRAFCHRAKENNVPVFITVADSDGVYESAKPFGELGIISVKGTTNPSLYMLIWFALSMGENIIKFVEEKTQRPK